MKTEWREFAGIVFTMVFQPIVDVTSTGAPYAYEALVRGAGGMSASAVLGSVQDHDRDAFDAACRVAAVEIAAAYRLEGRLSLNISPSALCNPRYGIYSTIRAARQAGFAADRLIFEVTEHDTRHNLPMFKRYFDAYRKRGVTIGIDDFGAGYAGLNTLILVRPDIIKLDAGLIRGIEDDPLRQALVLGTLEACRRVGISVIAEGIETAVERDVLQALGVELMQGYFFARPAPVTAWAEGLNA
jgi:EAL domain-containing protein (putative c-di-GMP-specific phosphodiesterase class I)